MVPASVEDSGPRHFPGVDRAPLWTEQAKCHPWRRPTVTEPFKQISLKQSLSTPWEQMILYYMKELSYLRSHGRVIASLVVGSGFRLLIETQAYALPTTFVQNGIGGSSTGAAHVDVFADGVNYQSSGGTVANITFLTFGQSYHMVNSQAGATIATLNLSGDINGGSIASGTPLSVSYDFTLLKHADISGTVGWTLQFSDSNNLTPMSIATGTLSDAGAASHRFSGSGSYTFSSGVDASDTFLASLVFTYVADTSSSYLESTMSQGLGQGITLGGAVPEPKAYAGLFCLGLLAFGVARRLPVFVTKGRGV